MGFHMKRLSVLLPISLFLFSCGDVENGADGLDGLNILVNTEAEPIGATCPSGGTKFTFGGDINGNGVLSVDEITSTTFICNGEDGNNGQDGSSNVDIQIVEWTGNTTNFYRHDVPTSGDGLVYSVWTNTSLTQEVIDNGFVRVDIASSLEGPWFSLPYQIIDGDGSDVNYIYTSSYSYGVGAVRIDWDCSFGRTLSEWMSIEEVYQSYYKITTIVE
jgi:hypothetical protein